MIEVDAAAGTNLGKVRAANEDAILGNNCLTIDDTEFSWRRELLPESSPEAMLVLDGMGGHRGGALASRLAGAVAGLGLIQKREPIANVAELSTKLVHTIGEVYEEFSGLGCTLVGLLIAHGKATVFNIGDSRCYRLLDGEFEQLTIDDRMADPRKITGSFLTQAIGHGNNLEPHTQELQLANQQRFLICSDGLSDYVDHDVIYALLETGTPAETTHNLIEAALKVGAPDNVSVVVADIKLID